MASSFKNIVLGITLIGSLNSCNNGPKVITPSEENNVEDNSGIFSPDPSIEVTTTSNNSFSDDLHKVLIEEVLPTERYIYLRVKEGLKASWIATRKMEVKKGETYFYRRALLKTNFESKEYNRVFDTIYLVSSLVAEDHSQHSVNSSVPGQSAQLETNLKEDIPTHTEKIIDHKGVIKIAELVKDPKKYEGHTVQINGTCVKVNPNIMDRNWIHIQDGSKDDYDLVVTSNTFVPEGKVITIKATVGLNRDFGAGYKYDLILENGVIVQ